MNWTKNVLALMLVGVLMLPAPLFAATSTEAQLRAQVEALLKRVSELESKLNGTPVPIVSNGTLEIENVRTSVDGDMAIVSWTTSIASESRLMLDNGDGKVFESKFGTKHEVEIEDLEASQEYEFKITARSKDKKSFDDLYDTFTATKEYQASFVKTKGSCSIVRLEDTAGKAAKKIDLSVGGILATKNGNTARGSVKLRTDSKGEFEYCKPVSTLNIKGGKGMGIDIKLSIPKAGAKATEIPAEKSKTKPSVSECKVIKGSSFPMVQSCA